MRPADAPANDKEPMDTGKKASKQPRRKYWSQLHHPKGLRPQFVPVWVDEDFEEMGY